MHKGMEIMRFFAVKEWHFRSENTKSVLATMSSVDHDLFNVDTTIYQNLPKYINILWRGSRRYLLKDSDSSITTAKRNYIM